MLAVAWINIRRPAGVATCEGPVLCQYAFIENLRNLVRICCNQTRSGIGKGKI